MKISRLMWLMLSFLLPCLALRRDELEFSLREQDDNFPGGLLQRPARSIRVFSKEPGEASEQYSGRELFRHLNNVLRGGTVGVEFDLEKHKGRILSLWDKVKGIFPKSSRFERRSDRDRPATRSKEAEVEVEEEDLVGRGLINPRLQGPQRPDWERVMHLK